MKATGVKTMSQSKQVLEHLLTKTTINPLQALNQYGIFRLSARIHELKISGWNIETRYEIDKYTKKKYAVYSLSFDRHQTVV